MKLKRLTSITLQMTSEGLANNAQHYTAASGGGTLASSRRLAWR